MQVSRVVSKRPHASGALLLLALGLGCEEKAEPSAVSETDVSAEKNPPVEPQVASPPEPPRPPPWASRVSPEGGFPCDVDKVLAASCRRCHFEPQENDAPFSLVKYEDIEKLRSGKPISKLMKQMVEADLMPPLDEPVEPKVSPLTAEQKGTLLKWLEAGAPKNEEKCP